MYLIESSSISSSHVSPTSPSAFITVKLSIRLNLYPTSPLAFITVKLVPCTNSYPTSPSAIYNARSVLRLNSYPVSPSAILNAEPVLCLNSHQSCARQSSPYDCLVLPTPISAILTTELNTSSASHSAIITEEPRLTFDLASLALQPVVSITQAELISLYNTLLSSDSPLADTLSHPVIAAVCSQGYTALQRPRPAAERASAPAARVCLCMCVHRHRGGRRIG